jgi:hypothetical protein
MDPVPSRGTCFQPPSDYCHVLAIQTQFEGNFILYSSKIFFRDIEELAATICWLLLLITIAFASCHSTYHSGAPVSLSWNNPGINLYCSTLFEMLDFDYFPSGHLCGTPMLLVSICHHDLTLALDMNHAPKIRLWSIDVRSTVGSYSNFEFRMCVFCGSCSLSGTSENQCGPRCSSCLPPESYPSLYDTSSPSLLRYGNLTLDTYFGSMVCLASNFYYFQEAITCFVTKRSPFAVSRHWAANLYYNYGCIVWNLR